MFPGASAPRAGVAPTPAPQVPVSPASNGPGGILTAFGRGLFAGGNGIASPAQQPIQAARSGVSGAQPVGGGGITQPVGAPPGGWPTATSNPGIVNGPNGQPLTWGAPTATPGRNVAAPILGGPRVTPVGGAPTMTWGQSNIQPIINRSLPGLPSFGPQPVGQVPRQSGAAPVGGGGNTRPVGGVPTLPFNSLPPGFGVQPQPVGFDPSVANPLGWGARPQPMQAPTGAGAALGAGAPRGNRNRQPGQ